MTMKKYKYVLVDIGCIECGEQSDLIGIFDKKDLAESTKLECEEAQENNWHGQHSFIIFEWDERLNNVVNIPDYSER